MIQTYHQNTLYINPQQRVEVSTQSSCHVHQLLSSANHQQLTHGLLQVFNTSLPFWILPMVHSPNSSQEILLNLLMALSCTQSSNNPPPSSTPSQNKSKGHRWPVRSGPASIFYFSCTALETLPCLVVLKHTLTVFPMWKDLATYCSIA